MESARIERKSSRNSAEAMDDERDGSAAHTPAAAGQPLTRRVSFAVDEAKREQQQKQEQEASAASWLVLDGMPAMGCDCHHHVLVSCPPGAEQSWPLLAHVARALQRAVDAHAEQEGGSSAATSATPPDRPTPFHGARAPPIGVEAYVQRVAKHGKVSPVCWVSALCLIRRACAADAAQALRVGPLTVHRLLLSAVVLSAKLWDDTVFTNTFFGKVGGLPQGEVLAVEVELLMRLGGRVLVPWDELAEALHHLATDAFDLHLPLPQDPKEPSLLMHHHHHHQAEAGPVEEQRVHAAEECPQASGRRERRASGGGRAERCSPAPPAQQGGPHDAQAPAGGPGQPPQQPAACTSPVGSGSWAQTRDASVAGGGSSRGSSLDLPRRAARRRRSSSASGGPGGLEETAAMLRQRHA